MSGKPKPEPLSWHLGHWFMNYNPGVEKPYRIVVTWESDEAIYIEGRAGGHRPITQSRNHHAETYEEMGEWLKKHLEGDE